MLRLATFGLLALLTATLVPAAANHGDLGLVLPTDGTAMGLIGQYIQGDGCAMTFLFRWTTALTALGLMYGGWECGFTGTVAGVNAAVSGTGAIVAYCASPANPTAVPVTLTIGATPHPALLTTADLCVFG